MYYIYILKSLKHNKTYTGITDNIERRLKQHNSGNNFFTRQFTPWKIIHIETETDRKTARKREKYLKSAAGRKWVKINIFK